MDSNTVTLVGILVSVVLACGTVAASLVAAFHSREAVKQAVPPSNTVTNGYYAENTYFLLQNLVDLWRAERGLPPLPIPHAAEVYGRRVGDPGPTKEGEA